MKNNGVKGIAAEQVGLSAIGGYRVRRQWCSAASAGLRDVYGDGAYR